MADYEVQYASVVFKNKGLAIAKKEDDVVYDEVKPSQAAREMTVTKVSTGPLSDKEAKSCWLYQKLVYCFGSLCVIMVMTIIGVSVYFVSLDKRDKSELKQLKDNQTFLRDEIYNMTNLNNKISSDFKSLAQNFTSCKNKSLEFVIQVQNLTQQQINLIAENSQVKKINHDLQTNVKILTENIKTCKEQKLSQALQIIDEYCPKENNVRRCRSCPKGWIHSQSSCYIVHNPEPRYHKTWEEARENCRGKSSDLTVVGNEKEKMFVDKNSWKDNEGKMKGFWIGLRVEGRKWKWMNGNDLTNRARIQQPATEGQCVTSLQNREWKSVSCSDKNGWICEKKALSV
ncbi:C-type lectin domain family 4 member G-like [Poeciliopsis prolifica]|uniref:C-type lectin domain family 4 member G-like n=1 Tax=Poeciliopsis prolifica TaxID=188132 RepID=UPI0024134C4D|nr:C-type lectin domain family 4 member G-like [Poeciliopsis prolifica]